MTIKSTLKKNENAIKEFGKVSALPTSYSYHQSIEVLIKQNNYMNLLL